MSDRLRIDTSRPFQASALFKLSAAALLVAVSHFAYAIDDSFRVFDGTLYKHKPDLARYKIIGLPLIYSGGLWDSGKADSNLPSKSRLQSAVAARAIDNRLVVIDIEHWKTRGDESTVRESVQKYVDILNWARQAKPGLTIGYYGLVPIRDYWRAIADVDSSKFKEWQNENSSMAPIAQAVDALFPSVYTFYDDREGWVRYATANLKEARRLAHGKPVYVFLWPQYHESNRWLRGKYIPGDYWRLQLATAKKYADGIVIWGGWQQEWDDQADWWKETKAFLNELGRATP